MHKLRRCYVVNSYCRYLIFLYITYDLVKIHKNTIQTINRVRLFYTEKIKKACIVHTNYFKDKKNVKIIIYMNT